MCVGAWFRDSGGLNEQFGSYGRRGVPVQLDELHGVSFTNSSMRRQYRLNKLSTLYVKLCKSDAQLGGLWHYKDGIHHHDML